MGAIGKKVLGFLGQKAGEWAGRRFGKYTGVGQGRGGTAGMKIGETLGDLVPFKKGGRIGKTGKILAHKGEYLLPRKVRPTAKQIKAVRKRGGRVKRKGKGRKKR